MQLVRLGAVMAAAWAMAVSMSGCAPSCAAQRGGCQASPTARGDDVVCLEETETGTHITEPRCYSRSEIEERRKADRETLDRAQMNSNRPRHAKPDL